MGNTLMEQLDATKILDSYLGNPDPGKVAWLSDEIMTPRTRLEPEMFTHADRSRALRGAAAWCLSGAPGGHAHSLFSPAGPCAVGKALLNLHSRTSDWLYRRRDACTSMTDAGTFLVGPDRDDPRIVRAAECISMAATRFDCGQLEQAAVKLEQAADVLDRVAAQPDASALTDEDLKLDPPTAKPLVWIYEFKSQQGSKFAKLHSAISGEDSWVQKDLSVAELALA